MQPGNIAALVVLRTTLTQLYFLICCIYIGPHGPIIYGLYGGLAPINPRKYLIALHLLWVLRTHKAN